MKLRHLPTFCAVLLALLPALGNAQTTAVPNFISYQGRVTDGSGDSVGANNPVNRTVIFRIWDNPTSTNAANLIYSESQTVTIFNGEFSVLVGQGATNQFESFNYSETGKQLGDLATAFTGYPRFLGVTVAADADIAATDNEISPRQQIVSTAFAMRAKFAESIGSSSDLALTPLSGTASNYGLGWYGAGRPFDNTAVDGPVLYGNSGGALGSNVSGSQKTALRWDASGRVGIGATSISSGTNKLTLQGDMGATPADQLTVRGNANTDKRLLLGYDTSANKASLQSYTALSTTGQLLLNPSGGNVGVNTSEPSVALDVTGALKASTSIVAGTSITAGGSITGGDITANTMSAGTSITATGGGITAITKGNSKGSIKADGAAGYLFGGPGDSDGGIFSPGDGTITFRTNAREVMRIVTNDIGRVGINTSAPVAPLHVADSYKSGFNWEYYMNTGGQGDVKNVYTTDRPYSIVSDNGIRGAHVDIASDKRIKEVIGLSDSTRDLALLQSIEITDYRHKDQLAMGNQIQKKVIAQQVQTLYPNAVNKSVGVVPDIFKKADIDGAWVNLVTDLKVGEKVRLFNSDKQDSIHEVLEVRPGAFRTAFTSKVADVFVYGREVEDFLSVDYDALSMLNVSATQELARELKLVRDDNAALRRELDAMKKSQEASLIALEQRLAKSGLLEAVSLKTETGAN